MLEEKYPQADSTSFGFANRFTVGDRFIVSACEYINDHSDEVDYDTAMVAHIREGLDNYVRWLHGERH